MIDLVIELGQILTGVLGGDFSMLSSEGSLAGNESATEVGGSLVGSVVGSLGLEDLIGRIPTDELGVLGSIATR